MAGDTSTRLVLPKARFSTSSGSVTDSGFLSAALNDMARAGCYVYPGAVGGAAEVPYKELASILGAGQKASLAGKVTFTAKLDVGEGSSLNYSGMEVSPTVQIGVANVGPLMNSLHATSKIHRLDFSLYTLGGGPDLRDIGMSNVVQTLRDLLQLTVRHWLKHKLPDMTANEQKEARALHESNTEPLQILDRILSNSRAHKIDGLEEAAKSVSMIRMHFLNFLLSGFNSSQGEFWGGFLGVCRDVGLLYAPVFGGEEDNGSLIAVEESMRQSTDRTDLSVVHWRGTPGLPDVPVGKVIIPKVPMSNLSRGAQTRQILPSQATRTSITYPEGQTQGRILALPLPPYLSPVFQSLAGSWNALGRTVDGSSIRENMSRMRTLAQEQQEAVHKFLRGYAKNMFHLMKLQGSQASIQVPLSFDWEVGKAYKVGVRGVALFEGLLASINHAVSSKGQGTASTDLTFSHVLWGGNTF